MSDKQHRDLAKLEQSGSSARVLSLLEIHRRHGANPAHREDPFFADPLLNRAIIIKHRLRRDELGLFDDGRQTTTKIILPLDSQDLRLGARSVLVRQTGYEAIMESVFGARWMSHEGDRQLLDVIDGTLSLDPFLLREHLRSHGRQPAQCYFDLSIGDYSRMYRFVDRNIREFIQYSHSGLDRVRSPETNKAAEAQLARRLLASDVDADAEPLRQALQMSANDFAEGVFCWKGFLYYKWTLLDALPRAKAIAKAIAAIRPDHRASPETALRLEGVRRSLARAILITCETARAALNGYDGAFADLVNGRPEAFREFLRGAPAQFTALGKQLGGVNHVISFWGYRFPNGTVGDATSNELLDILTDFEDALSPAPPMRLSA